MGAIGGTSHATVRGCPQPQRHDSPPPSPSSAPSGAPSGDRPPPSTPCTAWRAATRRWPGWSLAPRPRRPGAAHPLSSSRTCDGPRAGANARRPPPWSGSCCARAGVDPLVRAPVGAGPAPRPGHPWPGSCNGGQGGDWRDGDEFLTEAHLDGVAHHRKMVRPGPPLLRARPAPRPVRCPACTASCCGPRTSVAWPSVR